MIDFGDDLPAILDDCGSPAETVNGPIVGRFIEDPVEVATASGQIILSSEPVFYTDINAINAIGLVRGDWIVIDGVKRFVRDIPRPDTSGLVRVSLQK